MKGRYTPPAIHITAIETCSLMTSSRRPDIGEGPITGGNPNNAL